MRSFAVLSILSSMAASALATELAFAGVSPIWPPLGGAVDRRDVDRQCFYSVLTELSPPEPSDTRLTDWATTAAGANGLIDSCTITAPASLSSAYISYIEVIETYFETIESKAHAIKTDCDADTFSLTFTQYCTEEITVMFTESGGRATATSEVIGPLDVPTQKIFIGAAPRLGGTTGAAVALAAVLGIALAL